MTDKEQVEEATRTLLDEILAERENISALPILDTRWCVLETKDAYIDERGNFRPPEVTQVSSYFAKEEDAWKWLREHKAYHDTLSVRVQYLREFTEQRWSSI